MRARVRYVEIWWLHQPKSQIAPPQARKARSAAVSSENTWSAVHSRPAQRGRLACARRGAGKRRGGLLPIVSLASLPPCRYPLKKQKSAASELMPSGIGFLPDGTPLIVSMADRRLLRLEAGGQLSTHAELEGVASWHCKRVHAGACKSPF